MVHALFLVDDLINGYGRKKYSERTLTYIGQILNQVDQNKETNVTKLRKLLMMCSED